MPFRGAESDLLQMGERQVLSPSDSRRHLSVSYGGRSRKADRVWKDGERRYLMSTVFTG